jgi:hypothetical protein
VTSPPPGFGDFQNEIYNAGLTGRIPTLPMSYAELERRAAQALPPSVLSYVAGGAGDEATQRANVDAFGRWGLAPRMLVGAKQRDLSVELFGSRWPAPLFMAPIGVIGICAQDGHGDLATARAAARTGVPMVTSTLMADPLEQAAAALATTPASSSSTPRPTATSPPASSSAPRGPGSAASSSPSTPGSPGGAPMTCPPPTSPSCAACAWPTTSPTRCSVPGWPSHPPRIPRARSGCGPRSSATR